MKIIFLDVDGVLNSEESYVYFRREFARLGKEDPKMGCRDIDLPSPIAMSNLKLILECCPDVKIVISSTWRILHMDILKEHFLANHLEWDGLVIGQTPPRRKMSGVRGDEIENWLQENARVPEGSMLMPKFQVDDFVILDDNSDMAHLMSHLVLTNPQVGLTIDNAETVIHRFGGGTARREWFKRFVT